MTVVPISVYTAPAATIPPSATRPSARVGGGRDDHGDEREAGSEVTRHPPADRYEEDQRAHARKEDRHVGVESHQERSKHRCAEHRDDVLQAESERLRR